MTSEWKPPAPGTPVWMAIPATDVERASKFYDAVFKLPWKEQTAEYPKDKIRMFDLNPSLNLSGGIILSPDETGHVAPGKGGVVMSWLVEDVDTSAEVIEKAGGKVLTEKTKEGAYGVYRYFQDTEGNMGSVYQMVM